MSAEAEHVRVESRWPAIVALLVLAVLLGSLDNRFRFVGNWGVYSIVALMIVPMLVAMYGRSARWLGAERIIVLVLVSIAGAVMLAALAMLIDSVVHAPGKISGLSLLASAIALWVSNVVLFSIIYWYADGGGPEARAQTTPIRSDWAFPQLTGQGGSRDWAPRFADYLWLGFETATAFSAGDVAPLTRPAKMLMLAESAISMITLVIVAARAINVLA